MLMSAFDDRVLRAENMGYLYYNVDEERVMVKNVA
jgi:hypothetical protein